MSILSHHFQQQRKTAADVPRNNLKASITPSVSSSPPPAVAPASAASKDIRALAASAREGTIGWEDLSDSEVLLRKFDMELKFGPSTGMTRMERWDRANAFGLNPPQYIRELLQQTVAAAAEKKSQSKNGSGSGAHSVFHTTVHGREQ